MCRLIISCAPPPHLWPFLTPSCSSSSSSSSCSTEVCWEPRDRARSSSSSSTAVSLGEEGRKNHVRRGSKWEQIKVDMKEEFKKNTNREVVETERKEIGVLSSEWDCVICAHLCWSFSSVRSLSSISLGFSCSASSRRLQSKSAQAGTSPTDLKSQPQSTSSSLPRVGVHDCNVAEGKALPLSTCSVEWSFRILFQDRWLLERMISPCGSAPLHDGGRWRCRNTPAGSLFWNRSREEQMKIDWQGEQLLN